MAELNETCYTGEDRYSDGDIEEKILEIVRSGRNIEEEKDRDFALLYHLSPVRENILSWYPFRPEGNCLEIGAGPGAITGVLCRKLRHVTAADLSLRRCRINLERHRDCDNLDIWAGNISDMKFPEKFDYVVLNGVFEYAGSFTEGPDPYLTFLQTCAGFLKEGGVLLTAIENRIGLKYFSGAPEDHTEEYMDGLKGYPGRKDVRTFSKSEWESLTRRAGLEMGRVYYPYPDYKFPSEIFTDESLSADFFRRSSWNFDPRRVELFDESKMAETLQREGVLGTFMNSFLLEIRRKPGECMPQGRRDDTEVLYAKLSTDRARQFRIQTVISRSGGQKRVTKSPLVPEAAEHLRRMHVREMEDAGAEAEAGGQKISFRLLQGDLKEDGSIVYPYLEGENLGTAAAKAAQRGDVQKIISLMDLLWQLILAGKIDDDRYENCSKFVNVFGTAKTQDAGPLVREANIDLILNNVFIPKASAGENGRSSLTEGKVIDGEWIFDFPVPARFILWRAVNELYSVSRSLEGVLRESELLGRYGITQDAAGTFQKWAAGFANGYVKAGRLARWAKPVRKVDLRELAFAGDGVRMTATLYLDRGQGYREEDSLHCEYTLSHGRADIVFQIPDREEIRAVRFDPLEGTPCICSAVSGQCTLKPLNASARLRGGTRKREKDGGEKNGGGTFWEFLTQDPAYSVQLRGGKIPEEIRISAVIQTKDTCWALARSQQLLHRYQKILPVL